MSTEPDILEPLEPQDDRQLSRFIELDGDIRALATESGESIPALCRWLTRPDIAAYLVFYRQLKAQHLRDAALSTLLRTAAASEDPAEQRRAAVAILRAIAPAAARPPRSGTTPQPRAIPARGHPAAPTAPPSSGRASDQTTVRTRPDLPSPPHGPGVPSIRDNGSPAGSHGRPDPRSTFGRPSAAFPLGTSGRQPPAPGPRPPDSG